MYIKKSPDDNYTIVCNQEELLVVKEGIGQRWLMETKTWGYSMGKKEYKERANYIKYMLDEIDKVF